MKSYQFRKTKIALAISLAIAYMQSRDEGGSAAISDAYLD